MLTVFSLWCLKLLLSQMASDTCFDLCGVSIYFLQESPSHMLVFEQVHFLFFSLLLDISGKDYNLEMFWLLFVSLRDRFTSLICAGDHSTGKRWWETFQWGELVLWHLYKWVIPFPSCCIYRRGIEDTLELVTDMLQSNFRSKPWKSYEL